VRISGSTRVCGIVGDPVEHSMSPAMQNAAFRHASLDFVYVAFRLPRGSARAAAEAMRAMDIRGLNVTVPHKVDIIPFLDRVDPAALRIGAVNTVVSEGGLLQGYNTDAAGFMRGLSGAGLEVRGLRVVLLGAGGASRAVTLALADAGAHVSVLNRDAERAAALAADVSRNAGRAVEHAGLSDESLSLALQDASLLVNTTTVGMHPNTDATPVGAELLRPDLTVCDIVYNPPETCLLRLARERGCRTVDGVEMLVGQGALAFELWTRAAAPVEIMRSAVREELARAAH
jgi:shikimate dehydrogenase